MFIPAMAAMAIGCAGEGDSDTAISRPAAEEESRELTEYSSPKPVEKFDPAKDAPAPTGPTTTVSFSEYEFDFGTLAQGDAVTHLFEFTNSGDEPLIIDNCKGSCGCTVPKCPKNPIQPGEKGQIEVKFNSKGKKNQQTKKVTINANTDPAQTFLTIKAFVEAEPGT